MCVILLQVSFHPLKFERTDLLVFVLGGSQYTLICKDLRELCTCSMHVGLIETQIRFSQYLSARATMEDALGCWPVFGLSCVFVGEKGCTIASAVWLCMCVNTD